MFQKRHGEFSDIVNSTTTSIMFLNAIRGRCHCDTTVTEESNMNDNSLRVNVCEASLIFAKIQVCTMRRKRVLQRLIYKLKANFGVIEPITSSSDSVYSAVCTVYQFGFPAPSMDLMDRRESRRALIRPSSRYERALSKTTSPLLQSSSSAIKQTEPWKSRYLYYQGSDRLLGLPS